MSARIDRGRLTVTLLTIVAGAAALSLILTDPAQGATLPVTSPSSSHGSQDPTWTHPTASPR